MGFLTEEMDDVVEYGGYKFLINPAFDIVLEIQNLYKEEELTDMDKLNQALRMLVAKKQRWLEQMSPMEKSELLNLIFKQCVNTRKRPPIRQKAPSLDFEEDGEYIYASFMLDYGIDLLKEQGQLPWKKFIVLFQGLSENAKIREVMRIRTMELPRYNGHNQKQIQELQELKSYYALPARGGGGQQGLDLLFSTLEGMAVKQDIKAGEKNGQ